VGTTVFLFSPFNRALIKSRSNSDVNFCFPSKAYMYTGGGVIGVFISLFFLSFS